MRMSPRVLKGAVGLVASRAFHGIIDSPLPGRTAKPRKRGQTMVIDKGLGLSETGDLMELAGEFIDFVKLAFGTAALYGPELLRAKVALISSYGIDVYPGGTFLEVAMVQDRLEPFLQRAKDLGFTCIEVSDGTIEMSQRERSEAIRRALTLGFQVITEVGKKDDDSELDPQAALDQIHADLADGASEVIVEGRESGKGVGIYDAQGRIKTGSLEEIREGVAHPDLLVWETPLKVQQQELILRFGPNVNLGNIAPQEVLALEALRRGLRGDTLRAALAHQAEPIARGGR